jgi:hypothetical protein
VFNLTVGHFDLAVYALSSFSLTSLSIAKGNDSIKVSMGVLP